jgi:hypothetical protein
MKKMIFVALAILALGLHACASSPAAPTEGIQSVAENTQVAELVSQKLTASSPTEAPTATEMAAVTLNTTYENAVSIEIQLVLGSTKLKGSDNAVTQEQAKTLLPLWTNFKTLSESMKPAQGGQGQANSTPVAADANQETKTQIEALVTQIQAAMTPEQIQAISEMKITQETVTTSLKELGISATDGQPGGGTGTGGQRPDGTPPAGGPGGDMGAGGTPPADGGQQPGGGAMSTPQAGNRPDGGGFIPSGLIDALVKLLEEAAG